MAITLTKFDTQVILNSTDPGTKTVNIPASDSSNNGFSLDIKDTVGTDPVMVIPESGTIEGLPCLQFTGKCDLALRSNAAKTDWLVRWLNCYEPVPCPVIPPEGVGAIFVPGEDDPPVQSFLRMTEPLTGVSASPYGLLNVWLYRPAGGFGTGGTLFQGLFDANLDVPTASQFEFTFSSSGSTLGIGLGNRSGTANLGATYAPPGGYHGDWANYLFSWDIAHGSGSKILQFYHAGVDQTPFALGAFNDGPAFTLDYTQQSRMLFFSGPGQFQGGVYDLWFTPTPVFVDLSDIDNRRKFITDAGEAVDLGADGSTPFGFQPAVYFHKDGTDPVIADFEDNQGFGGPFAHIGVPFIATPSIPPLA